MAPRVFVALLAGTAGAKRLSASDTMYFMFNAKFRGGEGSDDSLTRAQRSELFMKRVEDVDRHNAKPGIAWRAGLNQFADYTTEEFEALLGHRPGASHREQRLASPGGSLVQISGDGVENENDDNSVNDEGEVAESIDWSKKAGMVLNQLSCGSCWAVAAAGALTAASEISTGKSVNVSFEQLVDCTPNPEQCGGDGGCKGATAELAFDWVSKNGVVLDTAYEGGYLQKGDGKCKKPTSPALSIAGFVRLPVNKLHPLMAAVTKGPVVVSVDGSPWSLYESGVFTDCKKDAILNHAVLATGYGKDSKSGLDYWLIRNSWGASYGEAGFIRLQRHSSSSDFCGMDNKPKDGVACKKDWETPMKVCGMCGVLSDSASPTDVKLL